MNQLLGSSSLSPRWGSRTAAVACTDSHRGWGGLALQKILVDVLGVPLQPSCIQQNIFTALLDSAFCRWSWVALKEGLYKKHTTVHKGVNSHRQGYILSPQIPWFVQKQTTLLCARICSHQLHRLKNLQSACWVCKTIIPGTDQEQQNASISLLEESHGSISTNQPKRCLLSVLTSLPGTASGTWMMISVPHWEATNEQQIKCVFLDTWKKTLTEASGHFAKAFV